MPPRVISVRVNAGAVPAQPRCSGRSHDEANVRLPFAQRRRFSRTHPDQFTASCPHSTRLRRNMFAWLNGPGRGMREPLKNSTNYISGYDQFGNLKRSRKRANEEQEEEAESKEEDEDANEDEELAEDAEEAGAEETDRKRGDGKDSGIVPKERESDLKPFPLNKNFKSESILSEPLREEIYRKAVEDGHSVSTISAFHGVDMRRVAAVVRLKTVEKNWIKEGKLLAKPYNSAVMSMLPQTPFNPEKRIVTHESINDLPVHPATRQQIFYPTSESRHFTRADAAKVFSPMLLPADERIPHPDLIALERQTAAGMPRDQRQAIQQERDAKVQAEKEEKERKRKEWEAKTFQTVPAPRWDFKFQNVSVEDVGKDGRSRSGVGWRYGAPHMDRKRGQVKIPTSVP